jgi:hypothetical protein
MLSIRRYLSERSPSERVETEKKWTTWVYDYFEGLFRLLPLTLKWAKQRKQNMASDFRKSISSIPNVMIAALVGVVFAVSGYMRAYDAFTSPVPNQSDGYVTLKWMKSISARILFPDEIYPMGHHIILSTIYKFANINALYVLKYTAPMNFLLLLASFYFFVSRSTNRNGGAIVAAIVCGFLSALYMGTSYERQASSNSQEFSFIFVWPSLYFFLLYLRTGSKQAMWSAAAGTAVIGLVHTLTFVWIGLGMGLLLLIHFLFTGMQKPERLKALVLTGISAVVLAFVPIGYGFLLGLKVNGAVADYASSRAESDLFPTLHWIDFAALVAAAFVLIHTVVQIVNKEKPYERAFCVLFTGATFFIYYFGGVITHNEVVTSRSGDLWYVCIPLIAGMAAQSVFDLWGRWKFRLQADLGVCTVVLAVCVYVVPIRPIIPYKIESKTAVEQYLRIASMFPPTTYMIVSPRVEEYSLMYGLGTHMYLGEGSPSLIKEYDPTKTPLTKYGETKHAPVAPDIFIFQEKKIYEIDPKIGVYSLLKPKYEQYAKDYEQLNDWIAKCKASLPKDQFSVFYEDENFAVYHLHRDDSKDEKMEEIYGKRGDG